MGRPEQKLLWVPPSYLGLNNLARPSDWRQLFRLQAGPTPQGLHATLVSGGTQLGLGEAGPALARGSGTRSSSSALGTARALPLTPTCPQPVPPPWRSLGSAGVCQPQQLPPATGNREASDSRGLLFFLPPGPGQAVLPENQLSQSWPP